MGSYDEMLDRHQQEIKAWVRDTLTGVLHFSGIEAVLAEQPERRVPTYKAEVGQHVFLLTTKYFMVSKNCDTDREITFSVRVPTSVESQVLQNQLSQLVDPFLGEGPDIPRIMEALSFMDYEGRFIVELSWGVEDELVEVKIKDGWAFGDDYVATVALLSYVRSTEALSWLDFQERLPTLTLGE